MSADIERTLGVIEGTLNGMSARQEVMHTELREARAKQEKILEGTAAVEAKIDGHVLEDDRNFRLIFKILIGGGGGTVAAGIGAKLLGIL